MPEPESRPQDAADLDIPAEDALEDAETQREAKVEAEALDAIPYERLEKEKDDGDD